MSLYIILSYWWKYGTLSLYNDEIFFMKNLKTKPGFADICSKYLTSYDHKKYFMCIGKNYSSILEWIRILFWSKHFFVFFMERPAPNSYGVDVVYLFGSLLLCDSWYSKFWNMMDEKNWTQKVCRFAVLLHQRLKSNIERIKDKKGISTNLWSINLKPMPFL